MTDIIKSDDRNNIEGAGEFYLLRSVPTVLRARGFRLYTAGRPIGRPTILPHSARPEGTPAALRLVDLWQNGGAAVLGHTPPSVLKEIKNTASRGLYAPFFHFTEGRFLKALSLLFPGRNFKLYSSAPPVLEPLLASGAAALWRPFLDPESPFAVPENAPAVLVPVIPGIQGWRDGLPLGLCVLAINLATELSLPPGDLLSPVLLAAATRGIYDLLAVPKRAKPAFPRIFKSIKNGPWQRQGIYLRHRDNPGKEEWAALFYRFLEAGFLIPPVSYQPLILPGELSKGEEAKLAKTLES